MGDNVGTNRLALAAVIIALAALIVSSIGVWATRQAQIDAQRYNKQALIDSERRSQDARRELCQANNRTNTGILAYVQQQIARSRVTLPTLVYYKEHPDELEAALDAINQQARDTADAFSPTPCD